MSINIPRPRNIHERVEVNGVHLEEVNDFKYLGAYVGSTTHDIKEYCLYHHCANTTLLQQLLQPIHIVFEIIY